MRVNSAQIFFVLWIFGPQYSMCNLDNSFVTVRVNINLSSIDLSLHGFGRWSKDSSVTVLCKARCTLWPCTSVFEEIWSSFFFICFHPCPDLGWGVGKLIALLRLKLVFLILIFVFVSWGGGGGVPYKMPKWEIGKTLQGIIARSRGAFFVWRAHILSWPKIMCSQVCMLIF